MIQEEENKSLRLFHLINQPDRSITFLRLCLSSFRTEWRVKSKRQNKLYGKDLYDRLFPQTKFLNAVCIGMPPLAIIDYIRIIIINTDYCNDHKLSVYISEIEVKGRNTFQKREKEKCSAWCTML